MKKLTFLLIAAMLMLMAVAVFAQDGFKDVPDDHWAYDAVSKLQAAGMVQGYPGGLFMGKRTLTRYEFAVVIQNVYEKLKAEIPPVQPPVSVAQPVDLSNYVTKADLNNILKAYSTAGFATKGDLDAAIAKMSADIKALGAEFRKELDSLGVRVSDLDAKVNDLAATVAALKIEVERVKITGTYNAVVKFANNASKYPGTVPFIDSDNRQANANDATFRSVAFLNDFDLTIKGKVSENTSVMALLNMGNYLNYLDQVDTYNYGNIARNATVPFETAAVGGNSPTTGFFDNNIFPYYLNLETKTGFGDLTVGRLPVQVSRYTLKKIDVDQYVTNAKTDDGNYPIDGFKLKSVYGGIDVLGFAGKTDNNQFLMNGLSSLFLTGGALDGTVTEWTQKSMTQIAGVNVGVGLPWDGRIGLTYTRNWSEKSWVNDQRNQDEVMGADLTLPLPWFAGINLAASAGVTNQLADVPGVNKLDWRNGIYDVKLAGPVGPVSLGVGYKRIGENYDAPGDWGKIGRWQNPRMIKGLYANLGYEILGNLKLNLGGEMYKFTDTKLQAAGNLYKDDKINRFTGGLEWKMSDANALGLDVEWISYDWTRTIRFDGDKPTEKYITLGWNHKLNDDTALKVGYQLISYDKGYNGAVLAGAPVPYANDYSGGLGVVQLGVSF
jgi:hypothetical protein